MTLGPLRPLRPFTVGILVDQIMQACHWKAHNTFSNFLFFYLTCSDNNSNMYLGLAVAVQQLLAPSPSHPQKEKGGGTSAGAKSSGV